MCSVGFVATYSFKSVTDRGEHEFLVENKSGHDHRMHLRDEVTAVQHLAE